MTTRWIWVPGYVSRRIWIRIELTTQKWSRSTWNDWSPRSNKISRHRWINRNRIWRIYIWISRFHLLAGPRQQIKSRRIWSTSHLTSTRHWGRICHPINWLLREISCRQRRRIFHCHQKGMYQIINSFQKSHLYNKVKNQFQQTLKGSVSLQPKTSHQSTSNL